MWLFAIFIIVPIVEIGLFIQVGGAIGVWPTLAIVVLTALVGTSLMRSQGIMTLNRLQASLSDGSNPADPIAQGAMILVAGVLLLTPGFFTDALGFALLLPPVRAAIIRAVTTRAASGGFTFTAQTGRGQSARPSRSNVIDGDYSVVDEGESKTTKPPSGWTKH